jgi:uncharacterized protein YyaL (SSP411 family)
MKWLVGLLLLLLFSAAAPAAPEEGSAFLPWSEATFRRAGQEQRILCVTVSTTWCHWCHVMKRETYGDARVRAVLARRFLPVDVDADARPDLAERFRNYRWPATAFLTPAGEPILALRGYRSPEAFLQILADVEARVARGGPYPGFRDPGAVEGTLPGSDEAALRVLRTRALRSLEAVWDAEAKGWGRGQKYPVSAPIEYGFLAGGGAEGRALDTLRAMRPLIDRVDGGMYQYSLEGRWDRWHPEKIMEVNAGALRAYAEAYAQTRDAAFLADARSIERWFAETLRAPEGTYAVSQDADAPRLPGERYYRLPTRAARAPYGRPRVDRSVYARENGRAIQALIALHRATGDPALFAAAKEAATRILRTHSIQPGLLRHGMGTGNAADKRVYLLDHVEMGRALLALHQVDLDEAWLDTATRIAEVLVRVFGPDGAEPAAAGAHGFYDASVDPAAIGYFAVRRMSLEGNARAARFLLTLADILAEPTWRTQAVGAIQAAARGQRIERHGRNVGDLLVALEQVLAPHATITIQGAADARDAGALLAEARKLAGTRPFLYLRRDEAPRTGASVCAAGTCSEPTRDAARLRLDVESVFRPAAARFR